MEYFISAIERISFIGNIFLELKKKVLFAPSLKMCKLSRSWLAYASVQLDRYIYTICIVHTDELRKSRQAIYMRQGSGHAQFEFTYDRFSRDAVQKATLQQILLDAYRT